MSIATTGRLVTGGVDTHSNTHHAAALDEVGRLLGTQEFPADDAGYRDLLGWLEAFGQIAMVGVEGTGAYGAGLTRYLRRHDITVIEVNRPDRQSRRTRGKSDPLDAENAARRALAGQDNAIPKDTTTIVEAIRVLHLTRGGAVKARTAADNQMKDLIITAPDHLRARLRGKTLQRVAAEASRFEPDQDALAQPQQATAAALRSIGQRVSALDDEIKALDRQLKALVVTAAPSTLQLPGVGIINAAQLLVTAGGNPDRLRDESSFAALCAACPIPASSGKTSRHRLNPGGDREANRALYLICISRLRHCQRTQAYIAKRQAEGLSKREAIRCLKRYIARQTYHAILADLRPAA